jgi:hypothetical protein
MKSSIEKKTFIFGLCMKQLMFFEYHVMGWITNKKPVQVQTSTFTMGKNSRMMCWAL